MDMKRAYEILNSDETIKVMLEGNLVWIDDLDDSSQTAHIHLTDQPQHTQSVPVAHIHEA